MVGTFDDLHVMLDDKDGMPPFDECVEGMEQSLDVMEVKSCGGLVKYK